MGRASLSLCCNLRDFPDKVIHDPDFLHLLAVHLLDLADQDFTDKPVQHCLIQFLDGGILSSLLMRWILPSVYSIIRFRRNLG